MPAVGEHLEPLVEGGNLGLEEDVPFFEEAEATLFGGGVVAVPPCLDGPGDGVGDALFRLHTCLLRVVPLVPSISSCFMSSFVLLRLSGHHIIL